MRATLAKLDKVKTVEIDFEKKIATVTMTGDAVLDKKMILTAFDKSSYGVSSFDLDKKPKVKAYLVGVSGMS